MDADCFIAASVKITGTFTALMWWQNVSIAMKMQSQRVYGVSLSEEINRIAQKKKIKKNVLRWLEHGEKMSGESKKKVYD